MSTGKPEEKKRGKVAGFFARLFAAPAKIFSLSVPAQAAIFMAIVLVALVTTAWLMFLLDENHVPWRHAQSWQRVTAVILLVILIPFVVYKCLQLWMEGDKSLFPDIDYAWKAGVDALGRNGMSLESTPVFFVLGSAGEAQEKALMAAANVNFRVRGVPEGPAALHWYANPDGIFLVCTQASWLSALATHVRNNALAGAETASEWSSPEPPLPFEAFGAAGESVSMPSQPARRTSPSDGMSGTIMADRFVGEGSFTGSAAAAEFAGAPAPSGSTAMGEPQRGTMMLQSPFSGMGQPDAGSSYSPMAAAASAESQPALLPAHESADQLQRLQYVCQLLRLARQPLCPVNGVLALLPFAAVAAESRESAELQRAVKADLMTVQRTLELRCPVTALVVGMEQERGFRELVRRVGRDRAAQQRFGRRFDVRSLPTVQELSAFCIHVCGAFEDWVYTLFREKEALTRPGNTRLYGLLCKVRCLLKLRLAEVLAGGFAYDRDPLSREEPAAFSGCYFAAAGETDDRQAFVKGVLDKLVEEQEDVEWTDQAQANDRRYRAFAYVGLLAVVALTATLVYQIVT